MVSLIFLKCNKGISAWFVKYILNFFHHCKFDFLSQRIIYNKPLMLHILLQHRFVCIINIIIINIIIPVHNGHLGNRGKRSLQGGSPYGEVEVLCLWGNATHSFIEGCIVGSLVCS